MIDDRQNIADFPSGLRATLPNNRAENKQLSLAMILHDLRAPMTTIMLALSHLQRLELPKESQRQIFLALSEAQRFRVTLDETLLFFSASKLQLCPLELNGAIEETLNLIPSIPDAKGREIRWVPTCGQVWRIPHRKVGIGDGGFQLAQSPPLLRNFGSKHFHS